MATTSAICGCGGSVTGVTATEITNWDIDLTIDSLNATSFASNGWKEKIACVKRGTGSFTSIGTPGVVGAATGDFLTGAGALTISGAILITKVTDSVKVDGVITYNHDFVFTGPITCAELEPA